MTFISESKQLLRKISHFENGMQWENLDPCTAAKIAKNLLKDIELFEQKLLSGVFLSRSPSVIQRFLKVVFDIQYKGKRTFNVTNCSDWQEYLKKAKARIAFYFQDRKRS